jgi:hypothetical protein
MSVLQTLKLTTTTPAPVSPERKRRAKLLTFLAEQKALAEATLAGASFHASRTVTRKNDQGERVRVDVPRHVRKAWFQDAGGKLFLQVRYGAKPLELAKGKNAIEVAALAEIPAVLDAVSNAVNQGELDTQLTAAAAQRRSELISKKRP